MSIMNHKQDKKNTVTESSVVKVTTAPYLCQISFLMKLNAENLRMSASIKNIQAWLKKMFFVLDHTERQRHFQH